MSRINRANLRKALYYLKRNGIRETWNTVRERLAERKQPPYVWVPASAAELERQRSQWEQLAYRASFSIVVPVYRTKPAYLRELVESLRGQTYPGWELILADATEDDSVEQVLREYGEAAGLGCVRERPDGILWETGRDHGEFQHTGIHYVRLAQNNGIAENTNQALRYAAGEYVGLLDHDDLLTRDALYEMARAIAEGRQRGTRPQMLYSDEDKCNGDGSAYYEPNFKEDFNLDLLLSNNYICHFLVMDRSLIQKLKFRKEYDGAQDYDLVLRAAFSLRQEEAGIVHVPRVLYHWRCHGDSTAENPRSKLYAYEAGRRAVQDYINRAGWKAKAADTAHVGFYTLRYEGSPFDSRADIGAIGGRVVRRGKVISGRLTGTHEKAGGGRAGLDAAVLYENLPIYCSGYLHRAQLPQDAYAVDLRNIQVRPECRGLFEEITGLPYREVPGECVFDAALLPEGYDVLRGSLEFGKALQAAGYRILYLPERTKKEKANPSKGAGVSI